MADWPLALDTKPLRSGYSDSFPDMLIRTQMDAGPAKIRRRYTAAIRPIQMSFEMTKVEVDILEAFYVTTLGGGALPFNFNHPRTGIGYKMRFTEPPKVDGIDDSADYSVSVSLEALPE